MLSPFQFRCSRSKPRDIGGVGGTGSSGSRAGTRRGSGSARRSRGWFPALPCSLRQLHLARSARRPLETAGRYKSICRVRKDRMHLPAPCRWRLLCSNGRGKSISLDGLGLEPPPLLLVCTIPAFGTPGAEQPGSTLSRRKESLPSLPPSLRGVVPSSPANSTPMAPTTALGFAKGNCECCSLD